MLGSLRILQLVTSQHSTTRNVPKPATKKKKKTVRPLLKEHIQDKTILRRDGITKQETRWKQNRNKIETKKKSPLKSRGSKLHPDHG